MYKPKNTSMMRIKLFIFLISMMLFIPLNAFAEEKLIFTLDLIRHGDRTPLYQIPKDPLNWREGLGELTSKGVKQEIQLGAALRAKYIDQFKLLPEVYDPQSVYVRSTDTTRTVKSATALMLGLYPLNTRDQNTYIKVHVYPKGDDSLLMVKPNKNPISLANNYHAIGNSWYEKTIGMQNKLDYWSSITGITLNNFNKLDQLADNLYVRQSHNIPLPEGISMQDAKEIISLNESGIVNRFKINALTHPMGKEFLKTLSIYLKAVKQNQIKVKYVLLSGHDSSILSVMNTLESPLDHLPAYAARVNFSLFKNEDHYYVKITYNDKPVYIPACQGYICSLDQLDKLGM